METGSWLRGEFVVEKSFVPMTNEVCRDAGGIWLAGVCSRTRRRRKKKKKRRRRRRRRRRGNERGWRRRRKWKMTWKKKDYKMWLNVYLKEIAIIWSDRNRNPKARLSVS